MDTLINILAGFIVGILIYKYLIQNINYNHHGPNSNLIKQYIYQKNGKYYQFLTQICPCPI
jgi:hypothetical protein